MVKLSIESVTRSLKEKWKADHQTSTIPFLHEALEYLGNREDVVSMPPEDQRNSNYHIGKITKTPLISNGKLFSHVRYDSLDRSFLFYRTLDGKLNRISVKG